VEHTIGQDYQDKEMSLRDMILKMKEWAGYLLGKWLIIVLSGLICGAIGVWMAYKSKTVYTANLTFAMEDERSGGGSGALSLASSFGFDLGQSTSGAFSSSNLSELFRSRKVIEEVLLQPMPGTPRVSFAEGYISFNDWRSSWSAEENRHLVFLPGADRSKFTLQQDSVMGIIYDQVTTKNLSVGPKTKKVSLIDLTFRSYNQQFAKDFAEALAKEVSEFYVETKSKKAKLNVEVLQYQADSIRNDLNRAIAGVGAANDQIFNLNPGYVAQRTPALRKQVDVQANTAILNELYKNLELAKVTLRKETPFIQIIDRPILPLRKERVGKLKSLIMGGMLGGLLVIVFFVIRKLYGDTMIKPASGR
jgi:uncharacterized protein involved in exopolysaccharide biosynthesis